MRRLLLLTVAGLLAGSAASASAAPDGPIRVRFDDQGRLCYYSDWIPMVEQCSELPVSVRDDGTSVRTEPVKADVGPGRVCAWVFSLPQECLGPS